MRGEKRDTPKKGFIPTYWPTDGSVVRVALRRASVLVLFCLITACSLSRPIEMQDYPLLPVNHPSLERGVTWIRAPFRIHDQSYPLTTYTETGEIMYKEYDEILFPTDVYIVLMSGMTTPSVFLARSPHGGCIVEWRPDEELLVDPCFGSRFDLEGQYMWGPAQRDLDKLPSKIQNGMIWVRNEIIYGDPH